MMNLNEAVKKVSKLPPAVTDAMKIPTQHHHKHKSHGENAQLLQQEEAMRKKGIEEALDKAKETLSNMMEETETELDEAILNCKEYDAQTVATLDTNAGYRAQLGDGVGRGNPELQGVRRANRRDPGHERWLSRPARSYGCRSEGNDRGSKDDDQRGN